MLETQDLLRAGGSALERKTLALSGLQPKLSRVSSSETSVGYHLGFTWALPPRHQGLWGGWEEEEAGPWGSPGRWDALCRHSAAGVPTQPGGQDQQLLPWLGSWVAHKTQQHREKPVDLISPAWLLVLPNNSIRSGKFRTCIYMHTGICVWKE